MLADAQVLNVATNKYTIAGYFACGRPLVLGKLSNGSQKHDDGGQTGLRRTPLPIGDVAGDLAVRPRPFGRMALAHAEACGCPECEFAAHAVVMSSPLVSAGETHPATLPEKLCDCRRPDAALA